MANEYTLSNSAAVIDSAITRVVSADSTPTADSDNMVTSSGVKGAIDELASSGTLTLNSFTPTTVETSNDGLTATDSSIPTSKAVADHVTSSVSTMKSWVTVALQTNQLNNQTGSGTATSDGFLIATAQGRVSEGGHMTITVAGRSFKSTYFNGMFQSVTVPIKQGESYSVVVRYSSNTLILFRPLF